MVRNGGRVNFEWPRHCAGWALQELPGLIQDLGMMLVDFEGCYVGLHDGSGELHLKRWRLATTCGRTARIFAKLRCNHPMDFKHVPITGSKMRQTWFYTKVMCEYVMHAMYPDIVAMHVPAMPVSQIHVESQLHREHQPHGRPVDDNFIFDSFDSSAAAARLELDEKPADD